MRERRRRRRRESRDLGTELIGNRGRRVVTRIVINPCNHVEEEATNGADLFRSNELCVHDGQFTACADSVRGRQDSDFLPTSSCLVEKDTGQGDDEDA